jgi:hypothetical protein
MCTEISIVLPRSADLDAVERLLEAHTLSHGLAAWEGVAVEPPLRPDEDVYGLFAWKYCHCGTALGSLGSRTHEPFVSGSAIRRLRRRGWSEDRIDRWIQQKEAAAERQDRDHELRERLVSADDTAHGWLSFIRDVTKDGAADHIGLAVSEGGPERLGRGGELRADSATARDLYSMETDVIYSFTA